MSDTEKLKVGDVAPDFNVPGVITKPEVQRLEIQLSEYRGARMSCSRFILLPLRRPETSRYLLTKCNATSLRRSIARSWLSAAIRSNPNRRGVNRSEASRIRWSRISGRTAKCRESMASLAKNWDAPIARSSS